jgi:16S rRNA processing protein RimM
MVDGDPLKPSLVVGRITSVHGIRGWLKVRSYTEHIDTLIDYRPWWVEMDGQWVEVSVDDWKCVTHRGPNGLIVHFKGVDDRDKARQWCGLDISIPADSLPELDASENYWYELVGLQVTSHFEGVETSLGLVVSVLATGANDVLVVRGDGADLDRRERLIPYVAAYVSKVDVEKQTIEVQWDPNF